jgi:CubicO group peptidase (beta-lactamase class C family)
LGNFAENQVQYLFAKPLTSTPGQTFTYNSAAIHILSVIISRKANMQTLDYANIHFFERLEMGERNWLTLTNKVTIMVVPDWSLPQEK